MDWLLAKLQVFGVAFWQTARQMSCLAFVGLFIGGGAEFGVCAARGRQLCF